MQQELLLEIFSEEIPARFQKKAISDTLNLFTKILNDFGATFSNIECYVSTRRITIRVQHLLQKTKDLHEEKRGPKIGATDGAISGFLKANGKSKKDMVEKDGYFYLNLETKGTDIISVIGDMIEEYIAKMPWQKSMRWYLEKQNTLSAFWVRPIRSILCIYDGNPVNAFIKSIAITTCDHTFGHRFLSSDSIRVIDFDDYAYKLEKNHVMLDYFKKRDCIDREIVQKAAEMGLCVQIDAELLDEVAGLVEYPFVHIGTIDEKFMKVPAEVLSTSMKVHQKYFTVTYPDSTIAPFFGTVTNVPGTQIMYEGLDRVLRARLSDAMFFFDEDSDVTLEAFTQRLSNVVFHEKLGSIAQKVDRMMSIANTKEEHRTVSLCKADLLTQMVGEFPELQGVMGEIYAKGQEEEPAVCVAIREHYKPLGANDSLPESYTGARVSFFDKIDTLVGFLGIGIYPTGSKDPFALRRAALCIVRLLCDFKDNILEDCTLAWYINTLIESYADQGVALDGDTLIDVEEFIIDRLKIYMTDKLEIDQSSVEAVINSYSTRDFSYKDAVEKAKKLDDLSKKEEFKIIQEAYKRAYGVIVNFDELIVSAIKDLEFENQYMSFLQNILLKIETSNNEELIAEASSAVLTACDNVMINDSNDAVKSKNLTLLMKYVELVKELMGDIEG